MKRGIPVLLFASVLVSASADAELAPVKPSFVPVMTRLMKVLGDKEKELQQAIANGNRKAVDAFLADSFEEQIGAANVTSVPREEWVNANLAHPGPTTELELVSARELGGFTALSFRFARKVSPTKPEARFIVDIWQDVGTGQWKLVARYSGPFMSSSMAKTPDGKR